MDKGLLNQLILSGAGLLAVWKFIGISFFNAGMVRAKNTLDILLKQLLLLTLIFVLCFFWSTDFLSAQSRDIYHLWPTLSFNLIPSSDLSLASFFFMAITVTLSLSVVVAATAERLKLWSLFWFALIMAGLILPLVLFWVWGKGTLHQWGFIDESGAATLHLTGAISGLVAALWIGPRLDRYQQPNLLVPRGANIPLAIFGVLMVALGCIGFYVGTYVWRHPIGNATDMALLEAIVFNTLLAGSGGFLATMIIGRLFYTRIDLTLVLNGALAGLFVVSAAPQVFSPLCALGLGAGTGLVAIVVILLLERCQIDDPMGAIGTHGTSALVGLLSVSFFVSDQPWQHVYTQLQGIALISLFVGLSSALLWLLVRGINHIRVGSDAELRGLDINECGMSAYPEFTAIRKN